MLDSFGLFSKLPSSKRAIHDDRLDSLLIGIYFSQPQIAFNKEENIARSQNAAQRKSHQLSRLSRCHVVFRIRLF